MKRTARRAEGPGWSLARRVTIWVAGCICGVLVLEAALVGWLVRDLLRRELDALMVEEASELRVSLLENGVSRDSLQRLAETLDSEHSGARVSLRVWRAPYAQPWVTVGAPARIPWESLTEFGEGGTASPDRNFRWQAASLDTRVTGPGGSQVEERIRMVLLIDGLPREASLKRASALLLLFSLVVGGATLLVGHLFARRLAALLAAVAESASLAEANGQEPLVAPERAPREIRGVVDAFRKSLQQLSSRHSRNVLLTAGLAHELRSPLQNLISEAEVGLLSDRDGREYRRLVANQLEELHKLALVVDNLITLTALRDRNNLPRGEMFDLAAEARIRLGHEEQEGARRNVTIEVHERGDCRCHGDREALVLMLRNLVGNAVHWTAENTTVDVTLDGRGESLRLVVDDEGPGVAEGEADAIFGAFFQGTARSGSRAGYGLGLALARTAARAEGGDVTVTETDAGGARFVVELPRKRE